MINFFRTIRQNLLSEKIFSKYLFYAAGEIILVVIGILIALSINNWNEDQKERAIEKEILHELTVTVRTNHGILTEGVERWQNTIGAIDFISNVIKQQLPYTDSLSIYFQKAHQNRGNLLNALDYAGYKSLENRGFNLLRNRDLRNAIITIFERRLPGLAASNEQLDFDNSGFHYEYIAQNFILENNRETPNDYDAILGDHFYYSILKRLGNSLSRKISRVNRYLELNQSTLELLEKELNVSN